MTYACNDIEPEYEKITDDQNNHDDRIESLIFNTRKNFSVTTVKGRMNFPDSSADQL